MRFSAILQETSEKYRENQTDIFRNFDPQIYTVWNFAKQSIAVSLVSQGERLQNFCNLTISAA